MTSQVHLRQWLLYLTSMPHLSTKAIKRCTAATYRRVLGRMGEVWVYDAEGTHLITVNEQLTGDWGKRYPSTSLSTVM